MRKHNLSDNKLMALGFVIIFIGVITSFISPEEYELNNYKVLSENIPQEKANIQDQKIRSQYEWANLNSHSKIHMVP